MTEISEEAVTQILDMVKSQEKAAAAIAPCSMEEYLEIVSCLPRPTLKQVDRFVTHVSWAHSWYKHLPTLPPGVPFRFFMDPYSGYGCSVGPNGECVNVERTDESSKFHYTWMTTANYRAAFGHLSYASSRGVSFAVGTKDGVSINSDLPVFSTDTCMQRIPHEVSEAGTVELTAIVHPHSGVEWIWKKSHQTDLDEIYPDIPDRCWPEETGGQDTLNQIMAIATPEFWIGQDDLLEPLIEPERERLLGNMRSAILRMLDLVYNKNPRSKLSRLGSIFASLKRGIKPALRK